jgi:hypothetical protein
MKKKAWKGDVASGEKKENATKKKKRTQYSRARPT